MLDGEYMKNVIVRNAVVKYEGGPLKLENTHFVNCTFQFQQTPTSRDLGLQLLAGGSVNFEGISRKDAAHAGLWVPCASTHF